ncbi:MAG: YggT family protein [Deltaproteobacteria bacterium]|nr:YggT family protein [Deltaproteobacteria bacterium]
MYIIGYFLLSLAKVIHIGLNIYMWIIIARAVISWVNPDPYNPIVNFLYRATDPLLYRIRRFIPLPPMGIDFTPIIVILAIIFLDNFLVNSLSRLAMQLLTPTISPTQLR